VAVKGFLYNRFICILDSSQKRILKNPLINLQSKKKMNKCFLSIIFLGESPKRKVNKLLREIFFASTIDSDKYHIQILHKA